MTDYCTYETALRLKDAGFTQPENWEGHVFHAPLLSTDYSSAVICVLDKVGKVGFNDALFVQGKTVIYESKEEARMVFSPTVTDMLMELGDDYELSYFKKSWYLTVRPRGWKQMFFSIPFVADTAAEVCEKGWIARSKGQTATEYERAAINEKK